MANMIGCSNTQEAMCWETRTHGFGAEAGAVTLPSTVTYVALCEEVLQMIKLNLIVHILPQTL